MRKLFLLFLVGLLVVRTEPSLRRRRQYTGYNYVQQYNNRYGLYGPGGQGWVNNYDNRYPNPNYAWNNNYNWNHGDRRPEWYYSSSSVVKSSLFCSFALVLFTAFFRLTE